MQLMMQYTLGSRGPRPAGCGGERSSFRAAAPRPSPTQGQRGTSWRLGTRGERWAGWRKAWTGARRPELPPKSKESGCEGAGGPTGKHCHHGGSAKSGDRVLQGRGRTTQNPESPEQVFKSRSLLRGLPGPWHRGPDGDVGRAETTAGPAGAPWVGGRGGTCPCSAGCRGH